MEGSPTCSSFASLHVVELLLDVVPASFGGVGVLEAAGFGEQFVIDLVKSRQRLFPLKDVSRAVTLQTHHNIGLGALQCVGQKLHVATGEGGLLCRHDANSSEQSEWLERKMIKFSR